MFKPVYTSKFNKDYKRVKKQNKDMDKLVKILRLLVTQTPLPARHRDHALTGSLHKYRECHIEPDWLLMYRVDGQKIIFERTGSHSELFK
ncbi:MULTISPECIES: type II toxin-antitoxin system YafQ family toxin [Gammaproteobacteria]|uniref:type II toxin-antitoxin system RelE/ParE family toxin n=1 Tax=Gammaproteobacteria TaxID=1236 RepID=UPI001ADCB411|nr:MULTISPECIES: type II toxin-antitoxin system YafQ family toxin [Gammaproteobacteria]MBO9482663.1 type II toxin-antitoxin system YafQ family toxin [Salinisphaera sp. G21_0]MBO9492802.1 type II toxin-antitoxin system YafQ family toxin [Thalassotalea sp. G20_0]